MMGKKAVLRFFERGLFTFLVLSFLFLVLISFSDALNSPETYSLGDSVSLSLDGLEECMVKVSTPTEDYVFFSSDEEFVYSFGEIGDYEIIVKCGVISFKNLYSVIDIPVNDSNGSENLLDVSADLGSETLSVYNSLEVLDNSSLIRVGEDVRNSRWIASSPGGVSFEVPSSAVNVSVFDSDGNSLDYSAESGFIYSISSIFSGDANKTFFVDGDFGDVEVEYYTPGPVKEERKISKMKKEVVISSLPELHYENVLAFADIDEVVSSQQADLIRVHWMEEGQDLDFYWADEDGNGLIDRVYWVVPHLSTQTFEIIIEIIEAQHLDEDRNFIEDVFLEVSRLDDLFKYIPSGHFVRVNFEKNLTSANDITLFAKSATGEPVDVEVYEGGSSDILATFRNIIGPGFYKVLLTGLSGVQSVFDLRVLGDLFIDLIVDPIIYYSNVHYTGWEVGVSGWTDGGTDSDRSNIGSLCADDGSAGGSYVWHLQDNSGSSYFSQNFDLTGYDYVYVNFSAYYTNIEGSEYLDFRCDGNSLWTYAANSEGTENQWLSDCGDDQCLIITPGDCTFDSSVELRFESEFSNDNDNVYVDCVNISGFVVNNEPTHTVPVLNSSSGQNYTVDNLTCYNQSTTDDDGFVVNTYSWYLDDSPVMDLYFPFNDNSSGGVNTTLDYSGNGNFGQLGSSADGDSAEPTWNSSGVVGGSYSLDGNDYIAIGDFHYLASSNYDEVTVMAWIKTTDNGMIITFDRNEFWRLEVGGQADSGKLGFQVYAGSQLDWSSARSVNDNVWHHVVGVFDHGDVYMYIDGAFDSSTTAAASTFSRGVNDRWGCIGANSESSSMGSSCSPNFNALIDDVRVYNWALSAEQINAIYLETKDGSSSNSTVVSDETSIGDNWTCQVTPNDGWQDGTTLNSSTLEVISNELAVTINSPSPSASLSDYTPLFNVSLIGAIDTLWYTTDSGATKNIICTGCSGDQLFYAVLEEGDSTVDVYVNNSLGTSNHSSVDVNVDMNYTYYDSFLDNSSIEFFNSTTWDVGNVSFVAVPASDDSLSWDAYTQTGDYGWSNSGRSGHSMRMIIDSGTVNTSGGAIRFRFGAGTDGNFRLNRPTICERDGSTSDCVAGTWKNITVSGSQTPLIPDSEQVWSDWLDYDFDETNDYLFSFYLDGTNDAVAYLTAGSNTQYDVDNQDLSLLEDWSSYSPNYDTPFYSLDLIEVRSATSYVGNFTSYSLNTTSPVVEILNVTWNEYGTDLNNNISVEISADFGQHWYNVSNGYGLSDISVGSNFIYRVLFTVNSTDSEIYLTDLNITWSDVSAPAPNLTIYSPVSGSTLADVTPLLNFSIDGSAKALWYNIDGGASTIICTDCPAGDYSTFIYVEEGSNTVNVYSNNSLGATNSNSSSFTVDMNYNYFDSFVDNSSILFNNNISWQSGNVTFNGENAQLLFYDGFTDTTDWTLSGGTWGIVSNQLSQSGNVDWTSAVYDLLEMSSGSNYNISMTAYDDDNDESGIVFRYIDSNNYYRCTANNDGAVGTTGTVLYRVEGGADNVLASDPSSYVENSQNNYSVVIVDNNISCYRNGELIISAVDSSWETGQVGIFNRYHQDALYDDFTVYEIDVMSSGNFTSYPINTTNSIVEIKNVSWTEGGGDDYNNNISVELSTDGGVNWYTAANGESLVGLPISDSLVYRILFSTNSSVNLSFFDMNISWSDEASAPPAIFVNSPLGTLADVSPTLNVSINDSASSLYYNINGGSDVTICTDCSLGDYSTYLYLAEGSYTVNVYAENLLGVKSSNSSSFTVDMNYNYFDSFVDNSSLIDLNYVNWSSGNVTFSADSGSLLFYDGFVDTTDWTLTGGNWNLAGEELRQQQNSDGTMAVYDLLNMSSDTDYNISMTAYDDDNDESGVIFRYIDSNNYYRCTTNLDPAVGAVGTVLYRVEGGSSNTLALDPASGYVENSQNNYSVVIVDNNISCYRNDVLVISAVDSSWETGQVGIFNSYHQNALYDDFTVYELARDVVGNFTAYKINTTDFIVELLNVSWSESGTDGGSNNISVEVSPDYGNTWYNVTNGYGLAGFSATRSLLYRVLFDALQENSVSLLDMNISWSNVALPPPNISILSPLNDSTLADVTPTLNISLVGSSADELWYSVDGGVTNYTICNLCSGYQSTFLHLAEGDYNLTVYADNNVGDENSNFTLFTVYMNRNYFDSFLDNSSLDDTNFVNWSSGNVTFEFIDSSDNNASWASSDETGDSTWSNSGRSDYSFRNIVDSSYINTSGGAVRFKFQAGTDGDLRINNPSICERYLSTSNCVGGTWKALTMGGVSNYLIPDSEEAWTDWVNYPIDSSKDYLVSFYLDTTDDAVGYLSSVNGDFSYNEDGNDLSLVENWSSYSPASEAYFYGLEDMEVKSAMVYLGNFTSYSINVSQPVKKFTNVSWSDFGGDSGNNNVSVDLSVDFGQTWYSATNGNDLEGFSSGDVIVYRVLFNVNDSRSLSLLDMNFTWAAPPEVTIYYPESMIYNSYITELNFTVLANGGSPLDSCWWSNDSGVTNYSIDCALNLTGINSTEGINNWTVYANDTDGSVGSDNVSFSVDLHAPNITFLNQTDEDDLIVNDSHPLEEGQNLTINANVTDDNLEDVWVVVWEGIKGGVEKARVLLTYVGGFLWKAVIPTDATWSLLNYNYTIYANDSTGLTGEYDGNVSLLHLYSDLELDPNPVEGGENFSYSGYVNLSNGTYISTYPVNLWFDGELLLSSNLSSVSVVNFTEDDSAEFSLGTLYNVDDNGDSLSISSGNNYGNFTRILDAGAMVEWNAASWVHTGEACSATLSWQEGVDDFDGTWDSYINGGSASTNYGDSETVLVDTNPDLKSFFRFDVVGDGAVKIPYDATVTEANITIDVLDGGNPVTIYEVLENWTEDDMNYNFRVPGSTWGSAGCGGYPSRSTVLEDTISPSVVGAYTFDITEAMKSWVNGTQENFGVVLVAGGTDDVEIYSSEYPTLSSRPKLTASFSSSDCTSVEVYVRLSNDLETWTDWQKVSNGGSISDPNLASRYLEYRVELGSINTSMTPYLESLVFNYSAVVTNESGFYNSSYTSPVSYSDYSACVNTSLRTMYTNSCDTIEVQSGVAPVVALLSPEDGAWFNYTDFNVSYNVSDLNDDMLNATLIINDNINASNSSLIINNGVNNFTIGFGSGQYNWTVNVTDASGFYDADSVRTFYIDLEDPVVSLIFPEDDGVYTVAQVNLTFNVSDNMDDNLSCDIALDDSTIYSGYGVFLNGSTFNVSSGILSGGWHYYNVTCYDEAGRAGSTDTYAFNISDTPPEVTLKSPENGSIDDDGNVSFVFSATDNSGFRNCSLIVDGVFSLVNQSVISGESDNTIIKDDFVEGDYNWTIECFDLSYSLGSATPWNLTVDLYAPKIDLNLPGGGYTSLNSSLNFNFTVNDSIDDNMSCNLTLDSVVVESFYAENGSLVNLLLENLTDGLKYWNVTCEDDAGHVNTSDTRSVTINEYPTIVLNTENESSSSGTSINLFYTPYDNTNFSFCSVYLNGALNQSNSSEIDNGEQNFIEISDVGDGEYYWYVNCSDSIGLVNVSETRVFYIDNSAPIATLYAPDGEDVYAANISFNFSVIDYVDRNITCNLTVDTNPEVLNFGVENDTFTNLTVSGLTDGFHAWHLNCSDDAGNSAGSLVYNFTRFTTPDVSLVWPEDDYWFSSSDFNLTYIASDDSGFIASYLIVNGALDRVNSTPINNGANTNFSISGFSDGEYNWSVNVTDSSGLNGSSETRRFYVDTVYPVIELFSPDDESLIESNNISFNFSVFDNMDDNLSCNLTLDSEVEHSAFVLNDSLEEKYLLIVDGNHTWNVTCVDEAGNLNVSETRNFTVIAPPNVTLDSPEEGYRSTSDTFNFTYTPIDPIGITKCELYIDGVLNDTDNFPVPNVQNNFSVNGVEEGLHNWSVNCTDPDLNSYMPTAIDFVRDISPPYMTLHSPVDDSAIDFNTNTAYFNFTADDDLDTILTCNLSIDSIVVKPNLLMTGGIYRVEGVNRFVIGLGEHYWNVTCWDQLGNANTSYTWFFNFTYPDFVVNASSIFLNDSNPRENDPVFINVTVFNSEGCDTKNVGVRIYNGDPDDGGSQIGSSFLVNLTRFNSTNVSVAWDASLGASQIFAVIDYPTLTNGTFNETNESNNVWNESISVGSWETFYGFLSSSSEFVLAGDENKSVLSWETGDFDYGNIYVVDSDSSVSWSKLQAIGLKNDSSPSSSDFSEIDSALSMTGYIDSVYNTFTDDGAILDYDSFTIFGSLVSNVPVVNSTNNTNFKTGILWDESDDIDFDLEYDSADKEDLVFVTKLNNDAEGAYGIYDYEIRVPARLREYDPTNSEEAMFYVELN